jgi:hypothetical protein
MALLERTFVVSSPLPLGVGSANSEFQSYSHQPTLLSDRHHIPPGIAIRSIADTPNPSPNRRHRQAKINNKTNISTIDHNKKKKSIVETVGRGGDGERGGERQHVRRHKVGLARVEAQSRAVVQLERQHRQIAACMARKYRNKPREVQNGSRSGAESKVSVRTHCVEIVERDLSEKKRHATTRKSRR